MPLAAGTKAPNFNLLNTERKHISLTDFAGKTLIIQFFPAAFTGVCTAQMCESRDELAYYNNMNATVIGVSTDMHFSLHLFKEKNGVNFDILSDYNRHMIHSYDMYLCNFAGAYHGVAKRGVVVVDKEGIIQYVEVTPSPGDQVNFAALKEAVEKLK